MGHYLTGTRHKFISDEECVVYANKEWKYIFFDITKEVEYNCKWSEIFKGYLKFEFTKDGKPVDGYTEHCLEMYTSINMKDFFENKGIILRDIRKQKLDKLKEHFK